MTVEITSALSILGFSFTSIHNCIFLIFEGSFYGYHKPKYQPCQFLLGFHASRLLLWVRSCLAPSHLGFISFSPITYWIFRPCWTLRVMTGPSIGGLGPSNLSIELNSQTHTWFIYFFLIQCLLACRIIDIPMARPWAEPLRPRARPNCNTWFIDRPERTG